jgi:transcriptional regulator with XRE-family HTH domain
MNLAKRRIVLLGRSHWMTVKSGAQIRALRIARGLNQRELAGLVGVTQQWISRLERGSGKACSVELAGRLCKHLKCDVEYLFDTRTLSAVSSTCNVRSTTHGRRRAVA